MIPISDNGFGYLVINKRRYTKDLMIIDGNIFPNWRREKGHNLSINDLHKALRIKPKLVVIGTGTSGMMDVDKDLIEYFKSKDITYKILQTKDACHWYNELEDVRLSDDKLVGIFHLTC